MNVHHSLICFFFLSLRDRNTGVISAETRIHTGTEGGNITVACSFIFSGRTKIFCKEECEERDFLLQTDDVKAQSGRYSIAYEEGNFPVSSTILYVSITKLTRSDAGKYRCGLHRSLTPSPSYDKFEIRVKDAPVSSKPNQTAQPVSTWVPSTSPVTTPQSLSSTHLSASPTKQSDQQQTTPAAAQTTAGVLLYVGLTLAVMLILLSTAVLIFCRKRATKPKEPIEEPEYADVTVANRVYEDIREEDRRCTKPKGVKTTDEYSLATSFLQKDIEDTSSELNYTEVNFSVAAAASLNSAPYGDAAHNVVYSVPRVKANADAGHAKDSSTTLYSTVTLH